MRHRSGTFLACSFRHRSHAAGGYSPRPPLSRRCCSTAPHRGV